MECSALSESNSCGYTSGVNIETSFTKEELAEIGVLLGLADGWHLTGRGEAWAAVRRSAIARIEDLRRESIESRGKSHTEPEPILRRILWEEASGKSEDRSLLKRLVQAIDGLSS